MDLLELFYQFRKETSNTEAYSRAGEAQNKAQHNAINITDLEAKVDHLSLVCMAMCELMENMGFSKSMILSKIEEIDLRDGKLDGKLASSNTCTECSRVVSARHANCLYCGAKVKKSSIV